MLPVLPYSVLQKDQEFGLLPVLPYHTLLPVPLDPVEGLDQELGLLPVLRGHANVFAFTQ